MQSFSAYLPVIVAVVTALFAVFTYGYQKSIDRKNALIGLRRTAYQDVLVALQKHLHIQTDESLVLLSETRVRAFIVSSDAVATSMGNFFSAAVNNQNEEMPDGDAVIESYANMVIAMRRDCFEETNLDPVEVVRISPVVWGEGRS